MDGVQQAVTLYVKEIAGALVDMLVLMVVLILAISHATILARTEQNNS